MVVCFNEWLCGSMNGCVVQCMVAWFNAWLCGSMNGCVVQCMYRRIGIFETGSREGKRSVNLLTESRSHYPFISCSGCPKKTLIL